MPNPQIVQYIQQNLRQGYDINSIKQHLMQYGYNASDVNEAAMAALGQQLGAQRIEHHISLSAATLVVIALIVLGLGTGGFLIYKITSPTAGPSQLLDLKLRPEKVIVEQGESILFMRELSNYGSATRYDIELTYTVTDEESGKVVASEHETAGIETLQAEKKELKLPSLEPGRYYLTASARYQGRRADAGFGFSVKAKEQVESCFDRIKNQGETGADCGGPCQACPTCFDSALNQGEEGIDCGGPCQACQQTIAPEQPIPECEDYNECTRNTYQAGQCVFVPITPCCGNNQCEAGESASCSADCRQAIVEQNADEIISQAKIAAKEDLNRAGGLCQSLTEERDRNRCFDEVAGASEKSTFCARITSNSKRDNCYIQRFAMQGDFTVCDKVVNKYLQKSCEQLSSLGTIGG